MVRFWPVPAPVGYVSNRACTTLTPTRRKPINTVCCPPCCFVHGVNVPPFSPLHGQRRGSRHRDYRHHGYEETDPVILTPPPDTPPNGKYVSPSWRLTHCKHRLRAAPPFHSFICFAISLFRPPCIDLGSIEGYLDPLATWRNSQAMVILKPIKVCESLNRFLKYANSLSSFAALAQNQDGSDFVDVTNQISSMLTQPTWRKSPLLTKVAASLTPRHVSKILKHHIDTKTALAFFDWISNRKGYKHDIPSYITLLDRLVPSRILGDADRIRTAMIKSCDCVDDIRLVVDALKKMNDDGSFKMSLRSYNMLLMGLGRFKLIDLMKAFYLEMVENDITPNIYTYNTMINGFCQVGNVSDALLYFSYIFQAGFIPDTFTYTSLMLGHCRNQNVEEAKKIFMEMPKKGCERNVVTYNVLIHGLCEEGDIIESFDLFSQMTQEGCQPNTRTYTILMAAICDLARTADAFELLKEMIERGIKPNLHTYTVLIDSLCRDKKLDDATKLLNQITESGLRPGLVTYNAIINGYCRGARLDDAFQILELMTSNGIQPNARTYNELICGLCRAQNVHKAMGLFSKMLQNGLTPCAVTFNSLIHGQCTEGRIDSALRLLDLMTGNDVSADQWTYSTLIDALCKFGRVEKAHNLFLSLPEKNVKANEVIYTTLIDGMCKGGKLDDALFLLERMISASCAPNSCTYNVMIGALCIENKQKEAHDLLQKMVDSGVKPTLITYTIFIDQLCREGNLKHALAIVGLLISTGWMLDIRVYTLLISTYFREGNVEEIEDLLHKMKSDGVFLDIVAYNTLIDGYGKMGLIHRAFACLKNMTQEGCKPNHKTYEFLIKHACREVLTDARSVHVPDGSPLLPTAEDNIWRTIEIDYVLSFLEKIATYEVFADIDTYKSLIAAFCSEGRLKEAEKLLSQMVETCLVPTEDIYVLLINCSCRVGVHMKGLEFMDKMFFSGHLPHLLTYKMLICGLYDEANIHAAKTLFTRLLESEYNKDEIVWTILIDGLLKRGHVDGCSELLCIMEEKGFQIDATTYESLFNGIVDGEGKTT